MTCRSTRSNNSCRDAPAPHNPRGVKGCVRGRGDRIAAGRVVNAVVDAPATRRPRHHPYRHGPLSPVARLGGDAGLRRKTDVWIRYSNGPTRRGTRCRAQGPRTPRPWGGGQSGVNPLCSKQRLAKPVQAGQPGPRSPTVVGLCVADDGAVLKSAGPPRMFGVGRRCGRQLSGAGGVAAEYRAIPGCRPVAARSAAAWPTTTRRPAIRRRPWPRARRSSPMRAGSRPTRISGPCSRTRPGRGRGSSPRSGSPVPEAGALPEVRNSPRRALAN